MPEEPIVVDCHECKDLAFARNLAAQMREGYGRHNSSLAFRPYRWIGALDAAYGSDQSVFHIRENQQARVIGRVGDHALRERWEDCEIGDAVPEEHFPTRMNDPGQNFVTLILIRDIPNRDDFSVTLNDITTWDFERVCTRMTPDDGRTWNDEIFWKRIS